MSKAPTVRLDRLLANLGYGSRKEVQALARHGHVVIDGEHVRDAEQRIALTADLGERLMVSQKPVDPLPGMALMLNKPLGTTCSCLSTPPLALSIQTFQGGARGHPRGAPPRERGVS